MMRIIGVDEVGRGSLAGDLLVCAFALREDIAPDCLAEFAATARDSKKFSSRRARLRAADVLMRCGHHVLERMSPDEIDAMNIRGATLEAMARAATRMNAEIGAAEILFDGADVPAAFVGRGRAIVGGDARVLEISAASIIAKVVRDEEMESLDRLLPGYGFARHAGYGTREHIAAIRSLGLSPVHRSWARKFAAG